MNTPFDAETTVKLKLEFFKQLIAGIDGAAQRVRIYFSILTVVSAMLLFATWNRYLSWVSLMVKDHGFPPKGQVPHFIRSELYRQWVDSLAVNIPAIGIKISVNEAPIIGLAALIFLATWAFYGARRENHLVAAALRQVNGEPQPLRALVFHGIVATQQISSASGRHTPHYAIDAGASEIGVPSFEASYLELIRSPKTPYQADKAGKRSMLLSTRIFKIIIRLPLIASLFTIIGEIGSLQFASPFRDSEQILWRLLSQEDKLIELARLIVSLALFVILWRLVSGGAQFLQATQMLLRDAYVKGWNLRTDPPSDSQVNR